MTDKIWYLKTPVWKYYEGDVKAQARKADARIIDVRFIGKAKNASDIPKEKTVKKEAPKKD
jgi:hypothetical protein